MLKVKIGGLQKSSLIDYPEKISAIVFTQGCNFRCPYCHNPELLESNSEEHASILTEEVLKFLKTRINKLDAVVITGGEPTLQPDLADFIKQIKDLGFLVKLDTNGTNSELLEQLLERNLIDYVAMDIKAPIEKYSKVVGSKVDSKNILKSIELIKNSKIDYEFRTTVVKSQLSPSDFELIGELIQGAKKYYLQRFVPSKTFNQNFLAEATFSDEEFVTIGENLKKYVTDVVLR